jgi:hypothetical protein
VLVRAVAGAVFAIRPNEERGAGRGAPGGLPLILRFSRPSGGRPPGSPVGPALRQGTLILVTPTRFGRGHALPFPAFGGTCLRAPPGLSICLVRLTDYSHTLPPVGTEGKGWTRAWERLGHSDCDRRQYLRDRQAGGVSSLRSRAASPEMSQPMTSLDSRCGFSTSQVHRCGLSAMQCRIHFGSASPLITGSKGSRCHRRRRKAGHPAYRTPSMYILSPSSRNGAQDPL